MQLSNSGGGRWTQNSRCGHSKSMIYIIWLFDLRVMKVKWKWCWLTITTTRWKNLGGGRDTEQKVGDKIVGQSDSGVIGRHHQSSFSSATTFFKQRQEHMGEGGIEAGEKHTVVSSRFSHRCNTIQYNTIHEYSTIHQDKSWQTGYRLIQH